MENNRTRRQTLYLELPTTDYVDAWNLQKLIVEARASGKMKTDVIMTLQHFPVLTVGRRGDLNNLTVSRSFLQASQIPVIPVERGGDITYHGPGQLVVYPIINLEAAGLKIDTYISRLEEVIILTLQQWDIPAQRNKLNRGVWVGRKKIGSIGICVRRGISFHGLALNVNLSLEPFGWINPCGLPGIEMTSMERELSCPPIIEDIRTALLKSFENLFHLELRPIRLSEIRDLIQDAA